MNDEMKNKLNEFLGSLIDSMSEVGSFAVEQIPDVVQQALTWFMLSSALWSMLSIPFFFLAGVILRLFWKKGGWMETESPDSDDVFMVHLLSSILAIIGLVILACNLEWLQILVSPKWFIVSEMSNLVH